jgi:CHRD domain-containing protein
MNTNLLRQTSILLASAAVYSLATVAAAEEHAIVAPLTGFNETPATISSPGHGLFRAKISNDGTSITYELSYGDLSAAPLQAHIHFGRPATSGGVVLFLCTNLAPPKGVPMPPACPAAPATVTGTLTSADLLPQATQGIDPGDMGFSEILHAIHAGAAYANVHTSNHPGGEIRGALRLTD